MKTPTSIPWGQFLQLIVKLIQLLLPLFTDPAARNRTRRALASLKEMESSPFVNQLPPIVCAVLRPAIDAETDRALSSLGNLAPGRVPWLRVLRTIIAILELLMDLIEPGPEPPEPEPPDPQHDLAKYTEITARKTVPQLQLDINKRAVAQALEATAEWCIAGDCTDCTAAREAARKNITDLLGLSASAWLNFSSSIDAALDDLASMGNLTKLAEYNIAYHQIAQGLRKA